MDTADKKTSLDAIDPFIRLHNHLFRWGSPLVFKALCFKAQHPQDALPFVISLTGPYATGKTLWARCIQAAFGDACSFEVPPRAMSQSIRRGERQVVIIDDAHVHQPYINASLVVDVTKENAAPASDKNKEALRIHVPPPLTIFLSNEPGIFGEMDHRRVASFTTPDICLHPDAYSEVHRRLPNMAPHLHRVFSTTDTGEWRRWISEITK